jgi:RNA polymerase sigma factor (sigma-70 family)
MSEPASVTVWIEQLHNGNAHAAQKLWEGYFQRLVALARARLRSLPRRGKDEEDVALSAFDSFFRGVERNRFPQLDDRDDLWQILFMITERKAIDLIEYERRRKRDVRRTGGEIPLQLPGAEPDPAFAAEVSEQCEVLLAVLPDDELRKIAVYKMEGLTNKEIAEKLGCSEVTIERRLWRIRNEWADRAKGDLAKADRATADRATADRATVAGKPPGA